MQVMSMLVYCRGPYRSPCERSIIKITKSHSGFQEVIMDVQREWVNVPHSMVANANVKNSLHFRRQMGRYLRKTENSLGWCDLCLDGKDDKAS